MSVPVLPPKNPPAIQAVTAQTTFYQVTMLDGTVLFVPIDSSNADYSRVTAWAQANNINL